MTTNLVLVCDPSSQIRRALQTTLRDAGYKVIFAATGAEAMRLVDTDRPQAVLLELELPDMDGIELCRLLRVHGELAIIVLSSIDDERAKIDALEHGADDYVTKPFCPGELLARLAARLRATPSALRFELDGLTIDLVAHLVTVDGREVHLTPIEFALLRVLATSGGPVPYRALASSVWGLSGEVTPRLRTHIANLRAKLDGDHSRDLIRTEAGVGYRFALPSPRQLASDAG
jgi:two-component system, OmpR family, KDP operon response regulator KdpE